ncbi:MAG TPA: hypothetical protein PLB34_19230, partial [Rhodoblastus sp.]|nr:hypothetical protein [Rhodoblastus sp.]
MADGPASRSRDNVAQAECTVGVAAARIAEAMEKRNVLAIVSGDYRARDILAAMRGAAPKAEILYFGPSDALPGDTQPATPANTGVRLATLRRARELSRAKAKQVVCITTAEAASEMLPKPATFDGQLTRFVVGGRIETEAFRKVVIGIGYYEDDRVDEPAEFAMRGRVIDIYPANAQRPVRLEIADGVVQRIREFDSVSQRGVRELQHIDLGSAAWPAMLGRSNTLFDYFADAAIALDPGAAGERERFLALAADAAHGSRRKATPASQNIVSQAAWDAATKKRGGISLSAGKDERVIRFAANLDPVKAMNAEIATALKERARIVIAGTEDELR